MQTTQDEASFEHYLRGRMPVLDGIRGLAITAVLVAHSYAARLDILEPVKWPYGIGWTGVDLFFALSGFLITGILVDARRNRHYYSTFYFRRFLRIFPLYYALLIFVFFVLPSLGLPHQDRLAFEGSPQDMLWYFFYLQNIGSFLGESLHQEFLSVTWSLAIEEQFYIFWPIVIIRFSDRHALWVCIALLIVGNLSRVILVALDFDHYGIYTLTFTRFDPIVAGAIVALSLRDTQLRHKVLKLAPTALLWGGALFLAVAIFQGGATSTGWAMQIAGYPALALVFAALLALAIESDLRKGLLSRLVNNSWLRFMGLLCYGLYLIHPMVVLPLRPILVDEIASYFPGDETLLQLTFTLVTIPLCVFIAYISWRFFEKPILNLKKSFAYSR